jgi:hypothetical protein
MDEVFKDEWEEWRSNKVTKAYLKVLFNKREYLKEMLVEQRHSTEQERMVDIGQCIAIKDNMNYAIFDFECVDKNPQEDIEDGTEGN